MQRICAIFLLLIVSPFLLFIMVLILLIEWKTPIFVQLRIGINKTNFRIYKLRTMKNGKITMLGVLLRKTAIDELPQLINIIKGDMNFVGPRPLTLADITRLNWNKNSHKKRWSVKPGITGMAQLINVCDPKLSWRKDMEYIESRSAKLDRSLLWQSILVPFIGKQQVKQHVHKSTT